MEVTYLGPGTVELQRDFVNDPVHKTQYDIPFQVFKLNRRCPSYQFANERYIAIKCNKFGFCEWSQLDCRRQAGIKCIRPNWKTIIPFTRTGCP